MEIMLPKAAGNDPGQYKSTIPDYDERGEKSAGSPGRPWETILLQVAYEKVATSP